MQDKPVFDYSKLQGRAKEKNITRAEIAKALGLASGTVSVKFNNRHGDKFFSQAEILTLCKLFDISYEDVPDYFFKLKVQ
jgi:transcriptional regulator with XRE-family HTH domain